MEAYQCYVPCNARLAKLWTTLDSMARRGRPRKNNNNNETDELRRLIEAQAAEAERRNQEANRRAEQIEQQGEMLRQLLTRLDNQQQQQPQPQQQQQPAEAARPAEANMPVPPMLQPNIRLPRMAPLIDEPVYERFRKQKPPMFQGTPDPAKAENWIKRIQQIFEYMQLTEAQKLACAVHQFDDEARCWWEVIVQTQSIETITWERFLALFYAKYLAEARLSGKVKEFMDLRQGKMTVAEYTAKFDELARYAPTLVTTDDARKTKYMHGLSVEIVTQVDSGEIGPRTYADAV